MTSLLLMLALATPNAARTPGAVRPLSHVALCGTKWGRDRRHITESMKRRVANAYGVPWESRRLYEFDHLIPRELAGADREDNLWPQPLAEAHIKDRRENQLHIAVCRGSVTLTAAQDEMRHWGRAQ